MKNDYLQIKKSYIVYMLVFILLSAWIVVLVKFAVSSNMSLKKANIESNETVSNCIKFCFLVNSEYAFVKESNCYCNQRQLIYDQNRNETITIFQTVNVGIVKNITSEKGLTEEALQILKRQQLQQLVGSS